MLDARIRMEDVARAAGVSVATVSRALKDDSRISPTVREAVKAVAVRMGYVPNPLVQSLMSQRRTGREGQAAETIALVTNYPHDAWPQKDVCRWYFKGIEERALQLGYRVEVFSLEALHHDPDRLGRVLRARGIRAAVLGFSRDEEHPVALDVSGLSVVGLSTYFRDLPVDRVHLNGFYNIKLACRHLRSLATAGPGWWCPWPTTRSWAASGLPRRWMSSGSDQRQSAVRRSSWRGSR